MILGFATGLPCESVVPWAASARGVYPGRVVLLTDEPGRYAPLEDAYGVELVPADLRRGSLGICDVSRTRWECLAEYLAAESGPVCVVDTRDAVFQSDPLERIGEKLVIGSEGKPHGFNAWALGWVNELAPEWTERMRGLPILCAGALGGPAPLLREFALAMYHRLPTFPCQCTEGSVHMGDQALVNVFFRDGFADAVEITDDWAFHCRSMEGQRWIPGDLIEGRVVRPDGAPFPIVHQYDVCPQLTHFAEIR